jgi:hypothetical protein
MQRPNLVIDNETSEASANVESDRLSDANVFLTRLDSTTTDFTFQTFDDNAERKDERLVRVLHGNLRQHADQLADLNSRGAGIYVTVNRTDLKGRKAENITQVRAVFVDLDGAPLEPVYRHSVTPQVIVETSPNKYHAYWQVNDLPLDHFTGVQLALAERFNGDRSVIDLPRVMRLPGFYHCKRQPYPVRIIGINDAPRYPAAIFERKQTQPRISGIQGPVTCREIVLAIAALQVIPPAMDWDDRNYIGIAMWRATGGDPEAFAAWCRWLQRSGRYDEWHAERQWGNYGKYLLKPHKQPVGLGTLIRFADHADPEWRDRLVFDLMTGQVA